MAKVIGLGPYLMTSVGRFQKSRTAINDDTTFNGTIEDRAFHLWIGAGIKVVLFP
jgi:hypothetical protein